MITAGTGIILQLTEDKKEKRKQGPYSIEWQNEISWDDGDETTTRTDLYAKVNQSSERLMSGLHEAEAEPQKIERAKAREEEERAECAATVGLRERFDMLREQSVERRTIRERVVKLVTSAKEERDTLPEELTSELNRILWDVDDVDQRSQEIVELRSEHPMDLGDATLPTEDSAEKGMGTEGDQVAVQLSRTTSAPTLPMANNPLDAQMRDVVLTHIRTKLGDISRTTLIRIVNRSNEPLRIMAGRMLESGEYVDSSSKLIEDSGRGVNTLTGGSVSKFYDLIPPDEIPPRTEVVIAARSSGASWMPTSSIEGEIIYASRDRKWSFHISFANLLFKGTRFCHVKAMRADGGEVANDQLRATASNVVHWEITKDERDRKENSEVIVCIDERRGREALQIMRETAGRDEVLLQGWLYKNSPSGLGLRWQKRWFVLTRLELQYRPR